MYVLTEPVGKPGSQPTIGHSSGKIDESRGSSWHRQFYRSFETGGIDQALDFNSVSWELPSVNIVVLIEAKVDNRKK